MTLCFAHSSAVSVSSGIARCGVSPVVLIPILRSLGSRSMNTREMSTMSFRVVGSPPEMLAISTFFQSGDVNDAVDLRRSSCRDLRSPRCQLLHISQRASQTNVQWKIRTVGCRGRNRARYELTMSRGALAAALSRYFAA